MATKRFDPDDEEALARAFALEGKGRRSKRGRRRASTPRRSRAWCVPPIRTGGAADVESVAARQTATLPEPAPDGNVPELTLEEFLDGM